MKNQNEVVLYQPNNAIQLEVRLNNETVWLTLDQISDLFQRNKSTISRHIKNVFEEQELEQTSVVAKFATTAADGKVYQVDYYNLDVIISVGYRVKSKQGTQFRQWANRILKEYLLKSHAINQDEAIANKLKLQTLSGICRRNEYLGINTTLVGSFPEYQPDDTEQTIFGFSKCELRILSMFPQSGLYFEKNEIEINK